ncbi:MAG: FtsH protease activity modulator HflK [Burkholderiales bacterium]|jgi:membrane protease subunit HflK
MRSNMRSMVIEVLSVAIALISYPFYRLRHALVVWRLRRSGVSLHGAQVSEMSLNDPQWGKRGSGGGGGGGNDGPPDLDQIIKKLNQKLAGLFGQNPAGNNGNNSGGAGGGAPSGAALGGGFALAASLALAVWLATGFYIVEEGSRGVELRLGKYSQTTTPGPRWHWPYPIETHEVVNISQVRAIEVGHRNSQKTKVKEEALMLTQDQNIVDVQFAVQYTLKSPEEYLFNNRGPDEAVRQVAETAMREIVGRSKMDYVLYEGRGEIASSAKVLMQKILDRYTTGILISTVNLQNAQPPEQVQGSFDDAVRAKQDKERLKNEGEAYANDILPKARGLAARLIEEANGHKQRVVANAQGDASRFSAVVAEYEKAPQVTRERMYLETIQQVMQNTSKVLVDQKGGQNLLYLPLDKIMQMSGTSTQNQSADPVAKSVTLSDPPATAAPDPVAARRDLRSRDGR